MSTELRIQTHTVGPIGANCFVASSEGSDEALVIDPGDEADTILSAIRRTGAATTRIWLTHGHIDHIGAAAAVKRATGATVSIHESEDGLLGSADLSGASWLGLPFEPCPSDSFLTEGQTIEALGRAWRMIHVPGHSPGSMLIYSESDGLAFGGDLIFRGSVGRTDLPGGDSRAISRSIRRVYAELPGDTRILTGHGPETTLAAERESNPYVRLAMGG